MPIPGSSENASSKADEDDEESDSESSSQCFFFALSSIVSSTSFLDVCFKSTSSFGVWLTDLVLSFMPDWDTDEEEVGLGDTIVLDLLGTVSVSLSVTSSVSLSLSWCDF